MNRSQRERIRVKLEAEVESLAGRLLTYLKSDPILPPRDALLRALKAFYAPWAMETQLDEVELSRLARAAIETLQLRIFQIQQRYLLEDSPRPPHASRQPATPRLFKLHWLLLNDSPAAAHH